MFQRPHSEQHRSKMVHILLDFGASKSWPKLTDGYRDQTFQTYAVYIILIDWVKRKMDQNTCFFSCSIT